MKTNYLSGLFIAIGIIVFGILLKAGIDNFTGKERYVSVKGLCEMEVKADYVSWPIVISAVNNNIDLATSKIEKDKNTILSVLKSKGLKDDEIFISPTQMKDSYAQNYVDLKNIKYRYNLKSIITVATEKVDVVLDLLKTQDSFIKKGIILNNDYGYQTKFKFNGLNKIKPEMIEKATKNARIAAIKFAEDSKSKLGKIKTANQGIFSIYDKNNVIPFIKKIRVVSSVKYYLKD